MKGIWVPVSGAIAQQKNVETIANNVANANTPGFKRDQIVFKEYLSELENPAGGVDLPKRDLGPKDAYNSYGAENAYVQVAASFADQTQGQLQPTGSPLDIAINGKGFVEVLTPQGTRFTRRGNFSLNGSGELVTDQGFFVLQKADRTNESTSSTESTDPNSRKIKFPNSLTPIAVTLTGEIHQGEQKIGDLSVVEFRDVNALGKEGNSLFINKDPANIKKEISASAIHQGFLEGSNVNAVLEMSNLIKANRHFESIQRAIKNYDNIAGKSVNEISRF